MAAETAETAGTFSGDPDAGHSTAAPCYDHVMLKTDMCGHAGGQMASAGEVRLTGHERGWW